MEKKKCSGCTACYNMCPKNAIEMVPDEEGFLYPVINQEKCINCGICEKVCPLNEDLIDNKNYPLVYVAKSLDKDVVKNSTSGGMFTVISDYILNQDGIVYGVVLNDDFKVIHTRVETKTKRDRMRGSKYVQSDLGETFKSVKKDLLNNKMVLFTGTPCQIEGLKKYLKNKDYPNLFLCDIVCHGVTSPLLWKERVNHINKKGKLKDYLFRAKDNGWHSHTEKIIYGNGKQDYKSNFSMVQHDLFCSNLIIRPSCYHCKYTSTIRVSDITLGDFWGIDVVDPALDDNTGLNLILVNTDKGKILFEAIKKEIMYKQKSIDECLQPQLQKPTKENPRREQFWQEYQKKGYKFVIKKYTSYGIKNGIKRKIKNVIKLILPHNLKVTIRQKRNK